MLHETIAPTPEMVKRLNLDVVFKSNGEVVSVKSRNRHVVDVLIDRGYIEEYHAEYGCTFVILREVWLGKIAGGTAMLSDAIQSMLSCHSPRDIYDHVYRMTRPRNARIIFWAMDATAAPISAAEGVVCRGAFDILANAFSQAHKTLAETSKL